MNLSTELTRDHIDLLITAAQRYGLLPSHREGETSASPDAAGLMLARQLSAARGRARLAAYSATTIPAFEPVEVIKACHSYTHAAGKHQHWKLSAARQWIETLLRAATEQLPGYSDAAWSYSKVTDTSTSKVIGFKHSWSPDIEGVIWVDREQLQQQWMGAEIVIVTDEALVGLPQAMPERSGVYLCCSSNEIPGWFDVGRLNPDVIVSLPEGRRWLHDQVSDPIRAYRLARDTPSWSHR